MRDSNIDGYVLMTMGFSAGERTKLFMVDRRKNQSTWWCADLGQAFVYDHKEPAERKAGSLRGEIKVLSIGGEGADLITR